MVKRVKRVDYGPCRRVFRPQEEIYFEQRKQANQPSKGSRFRWAVFLALGLLVMLSSMFTYTYSYFHDTAVNSGNYFQASHIGKYLEVYPGKAKAYCPSVGEPNGQNPPVAFYQGEELVLDFGEMPEGNSGNFENILWFKNITGKRLQVSWHMEGEIQTLVDTSQGSFYLLPDAGMQVEPVSAAETLAEEVYGSNDTTLTEVYGEDSVTANYTTAPVNITVADTTYQSELQPQPSLLDSVDQSVYSSVYTPNLATSYSAPENLTEYSNPYSFRLKLKVRSAPGLYQGFLVINVDGEFLSMKIPARVVVRAKKFEATMTTPTISGSVYDSNGRGDLLSSQETGDLNGVEPSAQSNTGNETGIPNDITTGETVQIEERNQTVENTKAAVDKTPINMEGTVENEEILIIGPNFGGLLQESFDTNTTVEDFVDGEVGQ